MKKIIIMFAALLGGLAGAQTNAPVAAVPAANGTNVTHESHATNAAPASTTSTNAAAKALTEITSDTADFDLNARQAVYHGHVRVTDPQVEMTCGELTVDLPKSGERLSRVVAETNVVIDFKDEKGQKYHVTAAKAVYDYHVAGGTTNETVTFTGNPRVETAQSIIESEPMIWNRTENKFQFVNPKMISTENFNPATGTTNGPALKLF